MQRWAPLHLSRPQHTASGAGSPALRPTLLTGPGAPAAPRCLGPLTCMRTTSAPAPCRAFTLPTLYVLTETIGRHLQRRAGSPATLANSGTRVQTEKERHTDMRTRKPPPFARPML